MQKWIKALCVSAIAIWVIAEANAGQWEAKTPVPIAKKVPSGTELDGEIYIIGGGPCSQQGTRKNYKYNPNSDSWVLKANMPTGRGMGPVAAAVNGKIYVIGGAQSHATIVLRDNEAYNPVDNSWVSKKPMPTERYGAAVGVVNEKIYVIGGHDSTGFFAGVEEYDPANDSWTIKSPMSGGARVALTASVVEGKIYVIGGFDGTNSLPTVEEYDPAGDSWTTKTDMPTARYWLGSAVVDGKIYVIGGFDGTGWPGTNEVYDPATNSWSADTFMPTPRSHLAVVEANGKIYAIAGFDENGDPLDKNEEFTPSTGVEEIAGSEAKRMTTMEAYPNPFTQKTEIRIQRTGSRNKSDICNLTSDICIYDLAGQLVKILPITNHQLPITIMWNGKDNKGNRVSGGVYFYQLRIGNNTVIEKILLVQ